MNRKLHRVLNRFLGSLSGRRHESDLAEELDSHLRMLAEESIRRGVPPDDAWRHARLQFGSVESTKESYRDQRGLPALDTLTQDLRYALRGIQRNPGFAAVAILSLAIGIGANVAVFSLVNGVLLRPLGYREPQCLFAVHEHDFVNPVHAREWAKQCPSLEGVALVRGNAANVGSGGEPVSLPGADVSHNLFALLGVEPILGRTFLAEEEQEGKANVAIISESLWRSRFNADRSLIGKPIRLDGRNYEVVGIFPAWLRLPYGGAEGAAMIFRPLALSHRELQRLTGNFNYNALVRVRPGMAAGNALAEINVVEARLARQAGVDVELKATFTPLHDLITGRARLGLWMLAAAVGAVLLIVCVNLANLLLSRMAARSRESAIRTALGASRSRQFRMVLTENLLLAFSGGALGILFANSLVQLLVTTTTLDIPRLDEVRLDSTVLAFACCLTALTGLLFGAFPAWLSCGDPQEALRTGSRTVTEGRRGLRVREGLISLEVGLSAALLIVAGLLTGSLTRLLQVDKGFDTSHILTVDLSLSGSLYSEAAHRESFLERLLAKVGAIPGVQSSGIITQLPIRGENWTDPIYLEGVTRPEERHTVNNRYASPGYFRVMNIAIRAGRAFDEGDRGRSVAVLSEKAAKLLWPGETNPVGRSFMGEDDKVKTLVGIVGDVRANLQSNPPATAYYPYWQRVPGGVTLTIRTAGDPYAAVGALRAAVRSEDPQLPVRDIHTMEELIAGSLAQRRFQSILVMVFAVSALLVATLGIYGVVSYSVTRRRNEIGIRIALGAQRSRLLRLVIRQGMAPVVIGLAAGVGVALSLGQIFRSLLFEVQPTDPTTIAAVAAVLLLVGVLACLIPALRAARTDALAALRCD